MVCCSYYNLKDKALNPRLGVQASPTTSQVSMSFSLGGVPGPGPCVKLSSPPSLPLGPNQSSVEFLPSFQQRSQTAKKRERERVGQEMPSGSQELE